MHYRVIVMAAGLAFAASATLAADAHRLAFSERLGVEVFAQPDSSGNWCRPAMALSLMLKDASPLLQGGIADFLPKLAPVLGQECPAATSLTAAAYKVSDRSLVGTTYTASKAGNWAATAVVQAPAESPKPPQALATAGIAAPLVVASPIAAPVTPPAPPVVAAPLPPLVVQSVRNLADPVGYWPLLARYVRENPTAVDNALTLKAFAAATDCRNYSAVANNEFRLNDYLSKTKASLMSEPVKPYVRFTNRAKFGQYNPSTGAFEFSPLSESFSWDEPFNMCGGGTSAIKRFAGSWVDGKSIFGLPASVAEAEALVDRINRHRYASREVYVELIAKPTFIPATPDGIAHINFELIEATVYADRDSAKVLHSYTADELASAAKMRQDAAAAAVELKRKAEEEQNRQRTLLQQRYQAEADLRMLQNAGKATRVAYFHNGSRGLSSVSAATGRSLIEDKPQPTIFMVKAGGNGAKDVEASWPGRLKLDLAGGLPELAKGQWYVVSGDLSVENPDKFSGKPLTGRLAVRAVSECRQDSCGDADDIPALIRRRYPDLPLQTGSIQ